MSIEGPIRTVQNGLVLHLDAGNNKSYPGSGTSWIDLTGNGINGTLTNGPTYSSANNGIIECMARATPIFINRIPAVVEYLGEGYPLYIDSQFDLEAKIKDLDLIKRAHLYLKTIRYKVEIGHFLESMVNSKIYKSL